MTPYYWKRVEELARANYAPATWDKKFARDMHGRGKDYEPSKLQRFHIDRLHHRYRRSIPSHRCSKHCEAKAPE